MCKFVSTYTCSSSLSAHLIFFMMHCKQRKCDRGLQSRSSIHVAARIARTSYTTPDQTRLFTEEAYLAINCTSSGTLKCVGSSAHSRIFQGQWQWQLSLTERCLQYISLRWPAHPLAMALGGFQPFSTTDRITPRLTGSLNILNCT